MTLAQYDMLQKIADTVELYEKCRLVNHEDSTVWTDRVIQSPRDKGVMTSMIRGGLVTRMGIDRLATIRMTKKGFDEWNAARKSKS
jgi:hypothetical protein